jgi:hypothetical protein
MRGGWSAGLLFVVGLLLGGCVTSDRSDYLPFHAHQYSGSATFGGMGLEPGVEDRILRIDPEQVGEAEVLNILSRAPAPRIILLHGGRWPVYKYMASFGRFLEGMGYPTERIRNPRDGTYSFSGYMSSKKIAGAVAWYYEREGLRPMLIGHSLGAFQTVRVLHQLAGNYASEIPVWNPLTGSAEKRSTIVDPLTGVERPVVGLEISFAVALGAGGLTRVLPNTWNLTGQLRKIPDSADALTGYYIPFDHLGGDFLGFGSANLYHALGRAEVRNVRLPPLYPHGTVPVSDHLLESRELVDWINDYQPTNRPRLDVEFESNSAHILWAADVWHDIRKHWVLELQRVIRAERNLRHEHG